VAPWPPAAISAVPYKDAKEEEEEEEEEEEQGKGKGKAQACVGDLSLVSQMHIYPNALKDHRVLS
jgi:hypothetical protein